MKSKKALLPSFDVLISLPLAMLTVASLIFGILFISNRIDGLAIGQSRIAEMYAASQQAVYSIESARLNVSQSVGLLSSLRVGNLSFSLGKLGSCTGTICRIITIDGIPYSLVIK